MGTFPSELALITGATGGLGKALAWALAKRKIPLFLTSTSQEGLAELAKDLRQETNVEFYVADLSLPSSREALLNIVRERAPDLVINNAGFGLYGESLSHPTSTQTKLLEVNVVALTEITLEAARARLAKNSPGTILNVSSATAFFSVPFFSTYTASKAFVNNFSRAFAREVATQGIRILVVCPGQIDTNFASRASKEKYKRKENHVISPVHAAEEILKQIENGPMLRVIDHFYRLITCLSRLLPQGLVENSLSRTILKRTIVD